MSTPPLHEIDKASVEARIAASGASASPAELDAIARSLARMKTATADLLRSLPFDETAGRFYGLLEDDAAGRTDP